MNFEASVGFIAVNRSIEYKKGMRNVNNALDSGRFSRDMSTVIEMVAKRGVRRGATVKLLFK